MTSAAPSNRFSDPEISRGGRLVSGYGTAGLDSPVADLPRLPIPRDVRVELTLARKAAQRAAIRAQGSLTLTKRRLHRDYRRDAGDRFLDWPRWRSTYLGEYRTSGLNLTEIRVKDFSNYA